MTDKQIDDIERQTVSTAVANGPLYAFKQIGILVHCEANTFGVACLNCCMAETPGVPAKLPVFWINVYPYYQHCMDCGLTLVTGLEKWPELYAGRR